MTKTICPKCKEELADGKCLFCGYEGDGKSFNETIKYKECPHKNITIIRQSRYMIPHGWRKESEKEDIDLGKYFIEEEEIEKMCEDCGIQLDE